MAYLVSVWVERTLACGWWPWEAEDGRRLRNSGEVFEALLKGDLKPLPWLVEVRLDRTNEA